MTNFKNVDEYTSSFPENIRAKLNEMRKVIRDSAPEAMETIAYGMAAYKTFNHPLVYFGGFANHIGFYATPTGHSEFAGELSKFRQGKGSVQFPVSEPLPLELISRITRFRVLENEQNYGKTSHVRLKKLIK